MPESRETNLLQYEVIDAEELGRRWRKNKTWIADQSRARAVDPIPHVKLGRTVRYLWGSPELCAWFARRCYSGKQEQKPFLRRPLRTL